MQGLLLLSLFFVFPALFCYSLETVEAVVDDDESSLVDIAEETGVKVEASDPGLDFYTHALDMLLPGTRNCPNCNGCKCRWRSCRCTKPGVVVEMSYRYYSCCGGHVGASFTIQGYSFYRSFRVRNGCQRVCGNNYCFNFCIQSYGRSIKGRLTQLQPRNRFIGTFNMNG